MREMRGGLKGFRIFLACLTLGVAAIAAVGSISESFRAGLEADASEILGGDIDLRLSHRPADDSQTGYLIRNSEAYSETVEMRAMARPVVPRPRRSLIELKAVDASYPLVGVVETAPMAPLQDLLAQKDGVWGAVVDGNLLTKLRAVVGDSVKVGETTFQIRALIVNEPDRVASVFSFGPRFMISKDALPATALIQPGSQTRYHYRMALTAGADSAVFLEKLKSSFPHAGWRIRTPDEAAPGVRRFIKRMTLFLTFVGLTVLLVGGIGVTNAIKTYLDGKMSTIATLKCIGAPGALVFRIYFLQVVVLGLTGTALGLVIGAILPWLALAPIADGLPVTPRFALYSGPLLTALLFGLLAAVTFALWPIARAREVPAAQLFRAGVLHVLGRPRTTYVIAIIVGVTALAGLTLISTSDTYFAA